MKIKGKLLAATLLFGGGIWFGSIISSNADGIIPDNQPGSIDDPVITKSYVDQKVAQMVADELSKQSISEDKVRQIAEEENAKLKLELLDVINKQSHQSNLVVVKLLAGQTLNADAGTEFIVRSGKALVISSDTNGISDLTAGKDIAPKSAIVTNHLLLFPKSGRGIIPDPKQKTDIFVTIRGGFMLVDANGKPVQ